MNMIQCIINIYTSLKNLLCSFFTTTQKIVNKDNNNDNVDNNNYRFIISNADNTIEVKSYEKISTKKSIFTDLPPGKTMDGEDFRKHGKELIDYIVDFRASIKNRRVFPDVQPGYLKMLLPNDAPRNPESFKAIMEDFESKIVKGMVFWNHPKFFAYFPSGDSYPSLIGEMLSGMLACIGFSWPSGPSCTELEIIVLDWFARALGLPNKFMSTGNGTGVLQGSASDCIMTVFLAARYNALEELQMEYGYDEDRKLELLPKLVAYCSKESHSCVEKAAKLCLVKLRPLEVTDEGTVAPETLEKAMAEDEAKGLKPFLYSAILGSTSSTAFDNLTALGPICRKRPSYFWVHADAAYAGSALICPEMRNLMRGLEYVNSFNINPNKWLVTLFDSSCLWVDDQMKFTRALVVDPIYLQHAENPINDRRHFTIALSRRFRALKLWFVFRMYGINKLQEYIRNHVRLAKYFERLVHQDNRFEVTNKVTCGLVCFRLKAGNQVTQDLLIKINESAELHMTPTTVKYDRYVIRFCVNYEFATTEHIDNAWEIIKKHAQIVLSSKAKRSEEDVPKRTLLQRRLSFTRSISKEQYEKRSSSLYDGATPILVVEEDNEDTNVFDEVFLNSTPKADQNSAESLPNGNADEKQ